MGVGGDGDETTFCNQKEVIVNKNTIHFMRQLIPCLRGATMIDAQCTLRMLMFAVMQPS